MIGLNIGLGIGSNLAKRPSWPLLDLSNPKVIWDLAYNVFSDDGVTPADIGDLVYSWDPMLTSVPGARFVQTTEALRPTLGVGANGKRRLIFNGSKWMQGPDTSAWFTSQSNCTMFACCKRTATGSYMSMFSSDAHPGVSGFGLSFAPGTAYTAYGNSYRNQDQNSLIWHRYAGKWLWDGTKNVGTPYYNGAISNGALYAFNTAYITAGNLCIGSRHGGGLKWTGEIGGAIGVLSGQASDDEMALIDAYNASVQPT